MPKNTDDDELFAEAVEWKVVGHGSHNQIFATREKVKIKGGDTKRRWVYRESTDPDPFMSEPTRIKKVWTQVNPTLPSFFYKKGIVIPLVKGGDANDKNTANEVLSIYHRTGRVVMDACSQGNFLSHHFKTVCVDLDAAVRPDSPISMDAMTFSFSKKEENPYNYASGVESLFTEHWAAWIEKKPRTIKTIKALVYLERYIDKNEIQESKIKRPMIDILYWCRENKKEINADVLQQLLDVSTHKHVTDVKLQHIFKNFSVKQPPNTAQLKR